MKSNSKNNLICIWVIIILSIFCQGDIFTKTLPDGTLQFSNRPTENGWDLYIKEKRTITSSSSKRMPPEEIERVIADIAPRYNVDPSLVISVIEIESGYRPTALSQKGAMGLMQLMPETACDLGVKDPWDPVQNITGGTKYLSYLLKKYNGDIPLTLAAYNAGPESVQNYNGIPPFQETIDYVKKVLKRLDSLKADGI
jgi:soluble lytic murein transglycosylase